MTVARSMFAEFLRARRDLVQPEDVGLARDPNRRVKGLRREELARLAGISLEYYTRLEQGQNHQVSDQVLASLSRALRLDDAGRLYFYRLAQPLPVASAAPGDAKPVGRPILALLEQWADTPAYVFDRNQDIVRTNDLAEVLSPGYVLQGNNLVEMVFTAEGHQRTNEKWRSTAASSVAALRFHGDPLDLRLQEIVGGLSVRDRDFRRMWADHDARPLTSGVSPNFVAGFGWVDLAWQVLDLPDGYFMNVKLAEPGTPAGAAIAYLAASLRGETLGTGSFTVSADAP